MRLLALMTILLAGVQTSPVLSVSPIEGLRARDFHNNFSERRGDKPHEAIDIMESLGTPVHAVVSGTIARLFLSKPGGNTIYEFDDHQVFCYYYAHLDRYAGGLQEGMHVTAGEVIGYVGSTGNASFFAPHLHFTIFRLGPEKRWWQGEAVNPYPFLLEFARK